MKSLRIIFLGIILYVFCMNTAYSLIKLDDDSVDIAIKYGLDNKYSTMQDLLGANWIEDKEGRIINIYSPFMQLAVKASTQKSAGIGFEEVDTVKKKLYKTIVTIKSLDLVKIHVSFFGDRENFATGVKGVIIPAHADAQLGGPFMPVEEFKDPKKGKKVMLSAHKTDSQKVADLDHYHPEQPYSAINTYSFKFEKIKPLKRYYFVLMEEKEEEEGQKFISAFLINNDEIF